MKNKPMRLFQCRSDWIPSISSRWSTVRRNILQRSTFTMRLIALLLSLSLVPFGTSDYYPVPFSADDTPQCFPTTQKSCPYIHECNSFFCKDNTMWAFREGRVTIEDPSPGPCWWIYTWAGQNIYIRSSSAFPSGICWWDIGLYGRVVRIGRQ